MELEQLTRARRVLGAVVSLSLLALVVATSSVGQSGARGVRSVAAWSFVLSFVVWFVTWRKESAAAAAQARARELQQLALLKLELERRKEKS